MNLRAFNRQAWDREVEKGNPWTRPVSAETLARARLGDWSVLLTETIPVPAEWFPKLTGLEVLGLACGGGQQGPILAAAGADVTILDNSPRQLERDREVAQRESLQIKTVEGDMRDLSMFEQESFDLIFHPVSNLFVPEIRQVWKEAYRVLRHRGRLLAGFINPVLYLFDFVRMEQEKILEVRYSIPYSDLDALGFEKLKQEDRPAEFGHTLTDQIGGQLDAGFLITGFYEDSHKDLMIGRYISTYMATCAVKL